MIRRFLVFASFALVAAAACNKTEPSTPSLSDVGGTWTSTTAATGSGTCTNFAWTITSATATSASGTFSATCGSMQVAGTASGQLSGTTVAWTANATGTAPGGGACAIYLTGTAAIQAGQIIVTYSGTTCLGAVSGTEVLKKS